MKAQYQGIVKLFSELRGKWQLWELWQDAITMFAISISNTVDKRFAEQREQEYLNIASKYSRTELDIFVKIFSEIVNQLEADQEQDFLGDLYMQLDLGSHWHGQFFTPYDVCQAMAEMTFTEIADVSEVKPISAMDCACGGGALLIAAAHAYRRSIKKTGLNPQNYLSFYAQDISRVTGLMCYVQLSLLGYAGKIKIGDSLCNPQYGKMLQLIMRKFDKPVTDYTADDIRLYIAYRLTQDKISKVSVQNEVRYLRTFFAWLFAEELIPKNPMLKVDSIKIDKVKKKAFTEIECEKLRQAARSGMEAAIVEVLLSTGCRVSELCMMKRDEIDGDRIIVHGKGNKDRTCFLNAKAQITLQAYFKERKDDNPYIFPKGIYDAKQTKGNFEWYKNPALIGEGMRDKGGIEATIRRMGKRAGVEGAHPHRFRRTCATFALQRGMPIELVSKMLGHEQLTTTQIYLDLDENDLALAHKKYVV